MTQEELKSLTKEYLGRWVSFKNDFKNASKELCTTTFIKPIAIKTSPYPKPYNETFFVGPIIKIDRQYQLKGLYYSENGYVTISTPTPEAVFPTEEQVAQFENIINIYNDLDS